MLPCPLSRASPAVSPTATSPRVWGLTIKGSGCDGTASVEAWEVVLWHMLDMLCGDGADRGVLHPQEGTASAPSKAMPIHRLTVLDVRFYSHLFFGSSVRSPILRRLVDTGSSDQHAQHSSHPPQQRRPYGALTRRLEVLRISRNHYDDSADLGAASLVAAMPNLRELAIRFGGLTSIRGLLRARSGSGTSMIRKVDLCSSRQLQSLAGLEHLELLEEVDVSCTAISSIGELQNCQLLRRIDMDHCMELTSLKGLENHVYLEEVIASWAPITSLCELQGCVALKKLDVCRCERLRSLDGLQGLARLEVLDVSYTAIAALCPLQADGCSALRRVKAHSCRHVSSLDGLQHHTRLEEVDLSWTAIASIAELRDCPALKTVSVRDHRQLRSLDGLENHSQLEVLDASGTAIVSLLPLREGCAALRKVDVKGCQQLASLAGLENHARLEEVSAPETAITSVSALLEGCPALMQVDIRCCPELPPSPAEEFKKNSSTVVVRVGDTMA